MLTANNKRKGVRIKVGKRLVNPDSLCMGCMTELQWPGMPCPKCGFDIRKYQRPKNSLPPYEILNGKYLLGRVLGIGGFGITYIAWDFYQAKRVCVKEYFPREIAVRNVTGTRIRSSFPFLFYAIRRRTRSTGTRSSPPI